MPTSEMYRTFDGERVFIKRDGKARMIDERTPIIGSGMADRDSPIPTQERYHISEGER